jgi:hypothetical protein
MDEYQLKNSITAFLDSAVPAGARVLDRVMARVEARRPQRRSHRGIVLVAVSAAAIVATVAAVSAATGNFPIRLNLVPFAPQVGEVKDKQPAEEASTNPPGKTQQPSTTIAAAQAAFGHQLWTPNESSGAPVEQVYFTPAAPVPAGAKPGQQPTPASVGIVYSYAGTTVAVSETFDSSSDPLTVDALDQGGPQAKGPGALGPVDIEIVGGSPYAVLRTTPGGPVETLMWKSAAGIVVTVQFDSPVSATSAFNFATNPG